MNRLKGRVVIVTGGASGIGRAIATQFAEEGVAAAICDPAMPSAWRMLSRFEPGKAAPAVKLVRWLF